MYFSNRKTDRRTGDKAIDATPHSWAGFTSCKYTQKLAPGNYASLKRHSAEITLSWYTDQVRKNTEPTIIYY